MVKGLMHRGEIGGVILGETGRRAIGSRRPLRGNLHLRHGVSLLSSRKSKEKKNLWNLPWGYFSPMAQVFSL